ncbi:MAG: hypothetical protein M1823_005608 [Watsoniomyces obsoletus]|nr:MAG: hypothetical protein M1823_005608 [Watsoniomyces obsoletus]
MKAFLLYALSGLFGLAAASPLPATQRSPISGVDQNALFEHDLYGRRPDDSFSEVNVERSIAGDELDTLVKRDAPYVVGQQKRQVAQRARVSSTGVRRGRATSFHYSQTTEKNPTACRLYGFDPLKDPFVALSAQLMGPKAYDNPNCLRPVTLSYKNRPVEAYVGDKCPQCVGNGMVVTPAVMAKLNPGGKEKEPLFGLTFVMGDEKVNPAEYRLDVETETPAGGTDPNTNQQVDPKDPTKQPEQQLTPNPAKTPTPDTSPGTTPNPGATSGKTPTPGTTPQNSPSPGSPVPPGSAQPVKRPNNVCETPNGKYTTGCARQSERKEEQQKQQQNQPQNQQQNQQQYQKQLLEGFTPRVQTGGEVDLPNPIDFIPQSSIKFSGIDNQFDTLEQSTSQQSRNGKTERTTSQFINAGGITGRRGVTIL